MDLFIVIIAALIGSLFSLVGGLYLIYGGKKTDFIKRIAVPFAAGALLAASFMDLIPEALHEGEPRAVLVWVLGGLLLFFVLERGLRWFHHHHDHADGTNSNRSLIVIGDIFHNFIDGLAIGAAFLINPATGIVATVAVAAHEIPQEIGDFALLLSKGMSRKKVVLINVLSALVTVVAAAFIFVLGSQYELPIAALLAITAGFFIYIAVSDIIPSIHAEKNAREANIQMTVLLVGVVLVSALTQYAHSFIGHDDHDDPHGNSHIIKDTEHNEEHRHEDEHEHDH